MLPKTQYRNVENIDGSQAEFVETPPHDQDGSIASLLRCPRHVRFTLNTRHSFAGSARQKSANNGSIPFSPVTPGESHLKKCIAREGLEGFYRMAPRAEDAVPWRSSRRFSMIWKTRGRETRNGMSCMR